MSLAASFLILSLALSITGSPLEVRNSSITLPLTRRLNFPNGTISNFLQRDKSRVAALGGCNTHGRRANNILVSNSYFNWIVQVGVGSPPTFYNLVVDSRNSITWVGGSTTYVVTDTSVSAGIPVRGKYSDDNFVCFFRGVIYEDTVTLGDGLTVTNFELVVSSDFETLNPGEDGYFGIGPKGSSPPSLYFDPLPTFIDCLFEENKISRHVVGIFLEPTSTTDPDNHSRSGWLTFGQPDNTMYTGDIVYTPVTNRPSESSRYWGFEQKITYGQEEMEILDTTVGIIDSSSSLIAIATDAYERYKTVTGAVVDPRTGLLKITPEQYSALQPLNFHIGGRLFSLTPKAQIWPRSLLRSNDPDDIYLYLVVMDLETEFGEGLDFRLGYTFMQRFYTVLDGSSKQIGFASTQFTDAT
ncbi:hypothetical protein BDR07DRAFT_1448971 [Suillus spraguei]|nr:hypothetical protein BDR07DRAFT_1448971 [Suillus spraguei]